MRNVSAFAFIAILLFCFGAGCAGDAGPAGPDGQNSTPGAIRLLVVASSPPDRIGRLVLGLYGDGSFNVDSTIDFFSIDANAPTLDVLSPYDAVLFYTRSPLTPAIAAGNVLADYVDQGGKLVMMQGCFTEGFAVGGRIMDSGYCPFVVSSPALNGATRFFWDNSIAQPPHKIFHGLNAMAFSAAGNDNISAGLMADPWGVRVAQFTNIHGAIAINTAGTIIGLNLDSREDNPGIMRLVGNAVHFLTGEL